jgi:alkylresorcinol/alkylpyrone synthase
MGCAGGVAGLARAAEFTLAYPDKVALLVAVETCSITFQFGDFSKKNFVATSLFADGAAAAVVVGERRQITDERQQTADGGRQVIVGGQPSTVPSTRFAPGQAHRPPSMRSLQFIGAYSTLFPNSRHVMGWDVVDTGLSVVFAPEIPARVARDMRPEIECLLAEHALTTSDVKHFALHPGGARVLDAYVEGIGLQHDDLRYSREVLRDYGNMSSPTVLFVLERMLAAPEHRMQAGDYVIMGALGPGFSSELALLKA